MEQQSVEISLAERKLNIACPQGQESALLAAASELDNRLKQCKPNTSTKSPEHNLLMTALNLANDLLQLKNQHATEIAELNSKIQLLQSTFDKALKSSQQEKTETATTETV